MFNDNNKNFLLENTHNYNLPPVQVSLGKIQVEWAGMLWHYQPPHPARTAGYRYQTLGTPPQPPWAPLGEDQRMEFQIHQPDYLFLLVVQIEKLLINALGKKEKEFVAIEYKFL